jgi:hypothetical protein
MNHTFRSTLHKVGIWIYRGCAVVGAVGILVLIAQQMQLLTVPGQIDPRSSLFSLNHKQFEKYALPKIQGEKTSSLTETPEKILCKITIVSRMYPTTGSRIYTTFMQSGNRVLTEGQLYAVATTDPTLNDKFTRCDSYKEQKSANEFQTDAYAWMTSPEWAVLRKAFSGDKDALLRASRDTDLNPRIIMSPIIGEQLRFFTSARSSFKGYFEPLKLFAHLSKFSFGVAGMKPETAARIEANLKNPKSNFYIGKKYENLLDYPEGADIESARMARITSEKDHYYSYLYVALYLKQFIAQWKHAGYDISDRPEVLATLYNLGHNRSIPKADPAAGGAPITLLGKTYTFGGLAYDFYWSGELQELFPYSTK